MPIIKTSELTAPALDWAVHKAKGRNIEVCMFFEYRTHNNMFHYSTDWSQGGPIIEREYIDIEYLPGDCVWQAQACLQDEYCTQYGLTPLIAAMRCFVASRLGDEVEIPAELT